MTVAILATLVLQHPVGCVLTMGVAPLLVAAITIGRCMQAMWERERAALEWSAMRITCAWTMRARVSKHGRKKKQVVKKKLSITVSRACMKAIAWMHFALLLALFLQVAWHTVDGMTAQPGRPATSVQCGACAGGPTGCVMWGSAEGVGAASMHDASAQAARELVLAQRHAHAGCRGSGGCATAALASLSTHALGSTAPPGSRGEGRCSALATPSLLSSATRATAGCGGMGCCHARAHQLQHLQGLARGEGNAERGMPCGAKGGGGALGGRSQGSIESLDNRSRRAWQDRGRMGEAENPGPSFKGIMSVNITSLLANVQVLKTIAPEFCMVQEHAIAAGGMEAARRTLKKEGFNMALTPAIDNGGKATAGVGLLARAPLALQALQPRTEAFAAAQAVGRASIALVAAGAFTPILCVSAYGWASDPEGERLVKTDALMDSIMKEVKEWPSMPTIIGCDLNAEVRQLPTLETALREATLMDLGARASAWGAIDCQGTSRAHNSVRETRIDYMLCNTAMVSRIQGFEHHGFQWVDVHAPISVKVGSGKPPKVRTLKMPGPIDLQSVQEHDIGSMVDARFHERGEELDSMLEADELTGAFAIWSSCFEQGLIEASPENIEALGRGHPDIVNDLPKWAQEVQQTQEAPEAEVTALIGPTLVLRRTIQHLAHLMAKHKPGPGQAWDQETVNVLAAAKSRAQKLGLIHLLENVGGQAGWARSVMAAKLAVQQLDKQGRELQARTRAERRKSLRSQLDGPKGIGSLMRLLREPGAGRLCFLETEQGTTSDPELIDQEARKVWGDIYKGNGSMADEDGGPLAFIAKYQAQIPLGPQQQLGPIKPKVLRRAFQRAPRTAPGPEGWEAEDLRHMTDLAAHYLARILNKVELGGHWPHQLTWARAVFLAKSANSMDIMQQRILTICSQVYRVWGRMRLHDMRDWIETWMDPSIYGGRGGLSAADSAWTQSFEVEHACAQGEVVSSLSIDLFKCFDQVDRRILTCVLRHMGAPERVLRAWSSFVGELKVFNTLAEGIGKPYRRPCSIPQGCALSMAWLSGLMTPLSRGLRMLQAIPRSLADDLNATTRGEGHWRRLQVAGRFGFTYLRDAGAKISATKSAMFSSSKHTRANMRQYVWQELGGIKIPVLLAGRDLGAHVSYGQRLHSGTLKERAQRAGKVCRRLRSMPTSVEQKHRALTGKVSPMALFGCECTPVPSNTLRTLRSDMKKALNVGTQPSASALLLGLTWGLRCHDPEYVVMLRRAKMARTFWHRGSEWRTRMIEVMAWSIEQGAPGAPGELVEVNSGAGGLCGAPGDWSPEPASEALAHGPITLLLACLCRVGVIMDGQWCMYMPGMRTCNLMHENWSAVHAFLWEVFAHAMHKRVMQSRASLQGQGLIDWRSSFQYPQEWAAKDRNLVRALQIGGVWSDQARHKAGMSESDCCSFCGQAKGDTFHLLWQCSCFEEQRNSAVLAMRQEGMEPQDLPKALTVHGLAPAVLACAEGPLWAREGGPQAAFHPAIVERLGHMPAWMRTIAKAGQAMRGSVSYEGHLTLPTGLPRAPEEPNMYIAADGTMDCPELRTIGVGIYIPEGTYPEHSMQEFEEHTHAGGETRGRAVCLEGWSATMARANALGILIACLLPGPVHIGTENRCACERFRKIAATSRHDVQMEDTVSLEWANPAQVNAPDGDLWSLIQEALKRRGYESMRVSYCKGPVSVARVDKGLLREADWLGLTRAKEWATRARRHRGIWWMALEKDLQSRVTRAQALFHQILRAILAVLRASADKRALLERCTAPALHAVLVTDLHLPMGGEVEVRAFRVMSSMPATHTWQQALHAFIRTREWQATGQETMVPWVVILVMFEVASSMKVVRAQVKSPFRAPQTVREALALLVREFKEAVKGLHPESQGHFTQVATGHHCLLKVGLKGYTTGIRCWPMLGERHMRVTIQKLLTLKIRLPRMWRLMLTEGCLRVSPEPINFKRALIWRTQSSRPVLDGLGVVGGYSITCPAACSARIQLNSKPSREGTMWPKVRCPGCKTYSRIGACLCLGCGVPIPRCECRLHQGQYVPGPRQADIRTFFGHGT